METVVDQEKKQNSESTGGPAADTTFQAYIKRAVVTDNPRGDFIEDFRDDREAANKKFLSWGDLEDHLRSKRAHFKAVEAGREAWRSYVDWKRGREHLAE